MRERERLNRKRDLKRVRQRESESERDIENVGEYRRDMERRLLRERE